MITEADLRAAATDTIVDWLNYVDLADDSQIKFCPLEKSDDEQTTTISFMIESADTFHVRLAEGTITIQATLKLDEPE